jgi:hypothetical protein
VGSISKYSSLTLKSRVVKEVVRKRFDVEGNEQKRDMMGSFIRHGINRTDAVAEATLQMYGPNTPILNDP